MGLSRNAGSSYDDTALRLARAEEGTAAMKEDYRPHHAAGMARWEQQLGCHGQWFDREVRSSREGRGIVDLAGRNSK